ncbi:hypothetical protein P7C70_g2041, partial [Phenoliferia sp. Uapishka_3]
MLVSEPPESVYSVAQVLGKGRKGDSRGSTITPSHFFTQTWLRLTISNERIFWLGKVFLHALVHRDNYPTLPSTNKSTGVRELLLDPLAFVRIQHTLSTDPAVRLSPRLSPIPAASFVRLVEFYAPNTKKLRAKMSTLFLENRRRVKKHNERWEEVTQAKEFAKGKGSVLAVSVVKEGSNRRKRKIVEIGWARWVPRGVLDVDDLARTLETSMSFEPNATKPENLAWSAPQSIGGTISLAHIIIEETPAGRDEGARRDGFSFGYSTFLPFEAALASIQAVLASSPSQLAVVGNVSGLKLSGHPSLRKSASFNLEKLFATVSRDISAKIVLKDVLEFYKVPHEADLQNAGPSSLFAFIEYKC